MSFRGDDQRRYGHVPPVQYPVSQHQAQGQPAVPGRRPSFNTGDDTTSFDSSQLGYQQPLNTNVTNREDELFLAGTADSSRAGYAGGGYQSHYSAQTPPTPSTYNPQAFARSQSTTLPYHPSPSSRWGHTNSNASSTPYSPISTAGNFAPSTYNPAAYANPTSPTAGPQRQQTYSGYNNYTNNHASSAMNNGSQQSYGASTYNQSPHWQSNSTFPSYQSQPQSPPAQYTGFDHAASNYPAASSPVPPSTSHSYDSSYSQYASAGYSNHEAISSPALPPPPVSPQAPYPSYSQIPVGPEYAAGDHPSYNNVTTRSSASISSVHSPIVQPLSSPRLARHPTNAPLPSRPLEDSIDDGSNGIYGSDEQYTQEDIMQDIENELSRGAGSHRGRPGGFDERNGALPDGDLQNLRRLTSNASYNSTATTLNTQDDPSGVHRFSSTASTMNRNSSGNPTITAEIDEDDSDPEGAAGAWALLQAEEDERRLSSVGGAISFPYFSQPDVVMPQLPTHAEEPGSDSDYAGMDLGLVGGGFSGNLNYDDNIGSPNHFDTSSPENTALTAPRRTHASQRSHDSGRYPAFEQADVDYGNTGGLQAPRAHRLSFDEDDDRSLHQQNSSESPSREDYPDMFYHPGLSNRPLPAIPLGSDSNNVLSVRSSQFHGYSLSTDSQPYSGPDALYGQNAQQLQVERSISLSSHTNTPLVQPPGRSKTDAAEDRNSRAKYMRDQQRLSSQQGGQYDVYEQSNTTPSLNYDDITLPTGKRKRFQPEKLTHVDVQRCVEPWALSGIAQWVREQAEGEPDLKRKTVEDGLVRLFCLKVPTMNVADAESLSAQVAESMLNAGILVPEEEWLKFGHGSISGVIWQLTGYGCYGPKLHEHDHEIAGHEVPGRCYSYHCTRTLKKANLDELMASGPKPVDWATFYNLTKEDIEGKPKKEVARQNILHEIVTSEEAYMGQLDVLRILYRDQLVQSQPRIIAENRLDKFVSAVFGRAESIQQINKDHLLAQLKYRQKEQGPWIIGFSDIFREWIRAARSLYIDYASAYPNAQYLVRKESERNFMFKQYLDQNQNNPLSQRLDWSTFLKAPITRLQRYILLMQTVLKSMVPESDEKANLTKAIDEVRNVALEADAKVDEMQKKVTMIELNQMLVLRPGFHADLNLDHLGRELILEGDLQRLGSKGVRWVDTHALLFDHYLILAKLIVGGRQDKKYDVSREPIPMPLLFLESSMDDPISKQKGIAAPLSRTAGPVANDANRLIKTASNGERPGLEHTVTNSSIGSTAVSRLGPQNSADSEGKILYPFRIKHLGHEVYTLFATSAQSRQDWCDRIIEAKTRHAKALHAQNAEPFRLRVMADSAFAYDPVSAVGKYVGGVHIRGTPLDRAIRELEKTFGPGRGPAPISRASVNCAAGFSAFGKSMVAVGTDAGVCVSEASDQRNWIKTVAANKVSQIAVLEEFSVVLVLSERNLISYPLDVVAPPSNFPAPANDSHRRSPLRLAKDVSFFATARMKDRMLVFYKRKESLHSTFKVLEPVFQKSTEKKSRLFSSSRKGAGTTDTFRDYDEFYLPTDCFGLNIFQSYIAVATAKGFELMTLDKKVPMSIPDVKQPAIANIANRIKEQKPLGMFRLNDQEFILAYEDCAVYIDKHGDVSRSVIMEYSGKQKKAKGATMYGQYLLLFNEDYVEVRNAENGRLRQIIAGRDVRVLDYGVRGPTGGFYNQPGLGQPMPEVGTDSKGTVKICMAHPEVAGQQIVLEMLLNTGHAEK